MTFGSQLNAADVGLSFTRWRMWRDTVATKWTRLKWGDPSVPYTLLWWKDYTGRTCRVMTYKDHMIAEPAIDLDGLLSGIGGTPPTGAQSRQGV